ncbi:MAG TPA: hypothetical protein VNU19_13045, partial [Candidatus Acidoferrum sp.]|nr:hypothetical protein [Candidatus Acidoferrum sp.]
GWWSVFGKKRGKSGKKPGPPVHDDLCAVLDKHGVIRHEFIADAPNEPQLVGRGCRGQRVVAGHPQTQPTSLGSATCRTS